MSWGERVGGVVNPLIQCYKHISIQTRHMSLAYELGSYPEGNGKTLKDFSLSLFEEVIWSDLQNQCEYGR